MDDDEDELVQVCNQPTIRPGNDIIPRNDHSDQDIIGENLEESSSDEESLAALAAKIISDKKKPKIDWTKTRFQTIDIQWNPEENNISATEPLSPLEYFFEKMATYTNIYAMQNNINFRATSASEMKICFALHIMIGCLNKFPRIRMYWEKSLHIYAFTENMSRDRFFQLRTNHHVNNVEKPPGTTDELYKVRPLIESVRRCRELPVERQLSVDEQMIPFTGTLGIKQYIKGKPSPWGIKVFVLCGISGQAYDFLFYQGKTTEMSAENIKKFGQGSSVVLHLVQRISSPGHELFFDNYFSSYSLLTQLKEKEILAAGTIRINRFFHPPVLSDKEMNRQGWGFSEEVVSQDGIVVVKWLDNRTVCLASNYLGKGTEDEAKRWDKKNSQYIEINRPEIVKRYNQSMGGVDLLDQLISLYRIFIRSKKWTLRVTMHMIDFALVN